MSDPNTSDMSYGDLLLEAYHDDILQDSQEDDGHSEVVGDSHLKEKSDVLNTVTPSSQDLLSVSALVSIGNNMTLKSS